MKRWFTLMLVLALCCTTLTGGLTAAIAEGEADAGAALEAAWSDGATEVVGETELAIEDVVADVDADGDPNTDAEPAEEAQASGDTAAYAAFYGRVILAEARVYAEAGATEPFAALALDDVVLATEPAEKQQRLRVAFNSERGVVTGYMDAGALTKLADEEYNAFMDAIAANVGALYNDDINYPLATLDCKFVDAQAEEKQTEVESDDEEQTKVEVEEQTVAAATAAPTATPTPVPTVAPTQKPTVAPTPVVTPVPVATPEPVADSAAYAVAAAETAGPPTDFTLPAALNLGVKEAYAQLTPALVPANSATTFTWRSSKPKIVEVNASTGALIAKKKDTAVIYAKSANGIEKSCKVTVFKAPKAIALNETTVVLLGGSQTFQLTPTLTKKTASTIYYTSSNPGVATVSASGLITTVAPGTATITAKTFNNKTATCTVKVLDPSVPQPATVRLASTDITIGVKQTLKLAPTMYTNTGASLGTTDFTVTSSTPKKLKVAADGTITGAKKGVYTVKVTAYNGVSTTCTVHVEKAPSKVALAPKAPVVGVGQTRQLTVSFPKGGVGTVSFSSSNTGVLTVDGNGFVTGKSVGSAVVTARTHNGKTAKVTVKVSKSPEYVALNAEYNLVYNPATSTYTAMYNKTLNPGESFQLTYEIEYGAYGDVASVESSNTAVATVTAGGLITAVAPGEATIVVRTTGGAETRCRVTVSGGAPAVVWYEAAEANMTVGQSLAVPALASSSVDAETLKAATYASSNAAVFTVAKDEASGAWTLRGVSAGTGVLTATVGEYTAQLSVTVAPAVPVATTPTYRLFAAYGYYNPDYRGYIPFTENNAKSVASVFGQSSISGLGYTTKVMGNPTKAGLLSGISSFFSGTADVDVSIVYLCSHGHMTNGYSGYRMSLPGYDDSPNNANYYMSSQEIFNCVSRIRGNVILILDSCYSGAFLQDMSGQLSAQGGRIAVLTAASDTRATYYNVKKTEKSVDFFTFFLLKGLGYNHRDKWWNKNAAGKRGAYPGYLAADIAGNGDGIVTLGEFFDYGAQSIAANIPSYMKKSWYWGDKSRVQVPRFYAGNLKDLVIYKAK
ncbi:MAG: Ig-like domain-containing protein [Clostridia bacterium]|nr:Ig-like domain-containing protein [Clostridia bacterium]